MRRHAFVFVMMAVLATFLTGCGDQDDDNDGVATLNGSSAETDDPEQQQDEDFEEQALAFSQCMRENGVPDFPDPEFSEDGGLTITREGGPGQGDMEAERRAMEACEDEMPQGGGEFSEEDRAEMEERMLEYAACMREHGIDMPDPQFDGEGGAFAIAPGDGGSGPNPDDPEFQEAHEACEEYFGGALERAEG